MTSVNYITFFLIAMLQWGSVTSFAYFPQRLHGLLIDKAASSTPKPGILPGMTKPTRHYALNPGVLEKIEDLRMKSKGLEESVANETSEGGVSREEFVEKLREMRTIIEAADSLTVIENDMKVIEEDIKSGKNSEIQTSARKVYQEFAECKELIEQQLNLVVDGSDDAITANE